jgi:hypothetical protein
MKVTSAQVRDAYLYLRAHAPFNRWELPPAGKINFALTNDPTSHAVFSTCTGELPTLAINPSLHLTMPALLTSVAHEMVHLRQHLVGRLNIAKNGGHNAEFRRLSAQVCRALGFDATHF